MSLRALDHFVQIEDRAQPHGAGQRAIDPDGVAALDEMPPRQVGGAKVVVAADGDERTAQPRCHVFDQAGLAAARGALQQHRQAGGVRVGKDLAFVALWQVGRGSGCRRGGWRHGVQGRTWRGSKFVLEQATWPCDGCPEAVQEVRCMAAAPALTAA